jgi:hypothetical protein
MSYDAALDRRRAHLAYSEAVLHIVVAIIMVVMSVSAFAVSTLFGIAATFVTTFAIAVVMPAAVPFLVAASFLFQNVVVAWYTPLILDNNSFDALRGANFIIVMAAFAAFLTAGFGARARSIAPLRPWILGMIGVVGVTVLYLGIGAIHGDAKDAVVYFRNIITPIACFGVAVVSASLYRINLSKTVFWMAAAAIAYGYCELFFTLDFLSLIHGDLYIKRDIWRQIQSGAWEQTLHDTGFVLRGLQDVMMTNVLNLPFFSGVLPQVFRINGPTFHSISFAYGLAGVSAWLLFQKRLLLPMLALPLLLVIGSKGALVMLLLAIFVRAASPRLGGRTALLLSAFVSVAWVAGSILFGIRSGDYHVLGLLAGVREFLHNPLGIGLGFGGNLSSTTVNVNWQLAQATGAAQTPMESAIGVMIYQMGIGSIAFLGFLAAIAVVGWRTFRASGEFSQLFLPVIVMAISANAVLQEEAFFSPLALAFALLLGGVSLGTAWNPGESNVYRPMQPQLPPTPSEARRALASR